MELVPGARARTREYELTREEAVQFARAYDPQPFHLDDAAAAEHPFFGRLSASGWLTCAIAMRLTVELWQSMSQNLRPLGGAGIEDIRWLKPVYPGDCLAAELEVLEVTAGKPRTGMRIVRFKTEVFNQDGAPVMRHVSNVIFPER